MAAPQTALAAGSVLLRHISWETYQQLLAERGDDQPGVRFYYDNGNLEIKMPSAKHEKPNRILAQLIDVLAEEMNLDLEPFGSTTFNREDLLKGFEPDSCFYIQNADPIVGKDELDLDVDPPPDLVIEVDVTSGSLDKFALFSAVGVPEVWRCNEGRIEIHVLEDDAYVRKERSAAFPLLTAETATLFLEERMEMKSTLWLRRVREWAREQLSAPSAD